MDSFALPAEARATAWADGLEPEGATPLMEIAAEA